MDAATALRALLAVLVILAGAWDLRVRRIPNWLTAPALLAGIAINGWQAGLGGLKSAALGLAAALGISLPFYALRGLGGGDVKLRAAVGAIVGPRDFLVIFVLDALLGGIAALVVLLWKGRLRRSLGNVAHIVWSLARLRAPHTARAELDLASEQAVALPRGAILAVAALLWLLQSRLAIR